MKQINPHYKINYECMYCNVEVESEKRMRDHLNWKHNIDYRKITKSIKCNEDLK